MTREATAVQITVDERWQAYLESLAGRNLTSGDVAAAGKRMWAMLRRIVPTLSVPDASPTNQGGLLISWDLVGEHLEIEILADLSYEWFYRERANDLSADGDQPSTETIPGDLLARLRQFAHS